MNTNRVATFLAGPELSWLLMYGVMLIVIAPNQPPTESGSIRLETVSWYVLIAAIIASFLPLMWLQSGLGWALLRIGFSGLIGVCVMSAGLCNAIRYNDSRDSGVGSLFVLMIGLGIMLLLVGLVGTGLTIKFKTYALPVLKWVGIVIGALAVFAFLINLLAKSK